MSIEKPTKPSKVGMTESTAPRTSKPKAPVSPATNLTVAASNTSTGSASGQAAQRPAPILSICIPTYKRATYVEAQVGTIIAHYLDIPDFSVELVVVNNKSPDDTIERLAGYSHPNYRLINRSVHYDTAEENMIRSLEYLTGEYVWFLGDDDPVHLASIPRIVQLLKSKQYGCLIFNSTTIHPMGHVALLQPMPMEGTHIASSIDKVVESIGLVNTFAGISNIIQLRSNLSAERGLEWIATSKIYSHVAWFVEANQNSLVGFFNIPLVFYRLNDYSDGHWDRVAVRLGVQSLYFWSLGLVRLLGRLIANKYITARQAGQLFELAANGHRYRLIDDLVFKTFTQLLTSASTKDRREHFTKAEFEEIRSFCLAADPALFDVMKLLSEAHTCISFVSGDANREAVAQSLSDKFLEQYNNRQSQGQFLGRFLGRILGFDLFSMPLCYLAVKSDLIELRERVLRTVDPVGDGVNVFVASSYDELVDLLTKGSHAKQSLASIPLQQQVFVAEAGQNTALSHEILSHMQEVRRSLSEAVNYNHAVSTQLLQTYRSASWKLTNPLRSVVNAVRGNKESET
jgi:Glycosyl transferase family 2